MIFKFCLSHPPPAYNTDCNMCSKAIMADEDGLEILRERLIAHSSCFNSLLELVPPKYYFADNEGEQGSKFFKNKKKKAPKQSIKEATKKAKLAKLDPSKQKSVIELQTELNSEPRLEGYKSVEDVECSDIVDLRTKLHQRIESLQKKRKASSVKTTNDRPTKKRKRKVKEEKNANMNKGKVNNGREIMKKPITNNDGKVVFSKFDFTSDVTQSQKTGKKQKKKNYKKLLEKAENRRKKLEEMKAMDKTKANDIVKQEAWKKALGKAEGLKPKDDPTLLRKALIRKEKVKAKHQKEWKERLGQQKKQEKEKQERRQRNIQERIENKKKKKIKKGGRTPGF